MALPTNTDMCFVHMYTKRTFVFMLRPQRDGQDVIATDEREDPSDRDENNSVPSCHALYGSTVEPCIELRGVVSGCVRLRD